MSELINKKLNESLTDERTNKGTQMRRQKNETTKNRTTIT